MTQLLARSFHGQSPPHEATLLGHLQAVHAAALTIVDTCGEAMLATFGLPAHELPRFRQIVAVAAAVHDVGKANDHFQGMLTRNGERAAYEHRQAVRHEWLSWWWLHLPEIREWAENALVEPDDWKLVLCCVAGHHPKARRATPPEQGDHAGSEITLHFGHSGFHAVTDWLTTSLGGECPQTSDVNLACSSVSGNVVMQIQRQFDQVQAFIENDLDWTKRNEWQRLSAAAKACTVAADVAGSALSERSTDIQSQTRWISERLQVRPDPADIEQLVKERLGPYPERPFQSQVAAADARVTLVTAGCGSGKTVAA